MQNKLSAVIITLNEAKNIARCIDSLQDVADEIIVLDSLSTDETPAICKQKNVKLITVDWEGYSATKNKGNVLAANDHVLSIDADEALSPQLQKEIIALKETGFQDKTYVLNRLTNYCGKWIKHCGWYPDRKPRIWNKNNAYWEGDIHEVVKYKNPVQAVQLKGVLYHYSYHSIAQHIAQFNKFTTLTAQAAFDNGKNAGMLKILFSPVFKFVKSYIFQLGFLDGYYGLVVCSISSFATFTKYAKLRQLNRKK